MIDERHLFTSCDLLDQMERRRQEETDMTTSESSVLIVGPERRKPGRPRSPDARAPVALRLSPQERERVGEAAKANRQKFAEFARDALMTAADDCLDPIP